MLLVKNLHGGRISLTKLVKIYCPDLQLEAHRADNDAVRLAEVIKKVVKGLTYADVKSATY